MVSVHSKTLRNMSCKGPSPYPTDTIIIIIIFFPLIYLFTLHPNHSPLHLTLFSHAPVPFSLGKMDPCPALYQSALAHWVASLRPDKAAQLARERDPKAETESE